jgi:hypothetical protein
MKAKSPLVITLRLSWHALAVVVTAATILLILYSAARAQDGSETRPSINAAAARSEVAPAGSVENADVRSAPPANGDLLPTINGEWLPADELARMPRQVPRSTTTSAAAGRNSFYLTSASYSPPAALTACAPGYHMASLWEILDVSNLSYAVENPAAQTKTDSGESAPSGWNGWIRTGRISSDSDVAGVGNCLAWTSTDPADYGTAVQLTSAWETDSGDIGTWNAGAFACNFNGPVWCVGD